MPATFTALGRSITKKNITEVQSEINKIIDNGVQTASVWRTPRTITLSGAVTGSVSIDGSKNVSITTTIASGNALTSVSNANSDTGSGNRFNFIDATLSVSGSSIKLTRQRQYYSYSDYVDCAGE
jgi:hypothetical protein